SARAPDAADSAASARAAGSAGATGAVDSASSARAPHAVDSAASARAVRAATCIHRHGRIDRHTTPWNEDSVGSDAAGAPRRRFVVSYSAAANENRAVD